MYGSSSSHGEDRMDSVNDRLNKNLTFYTKFMTQHFESRQDYEETAKAVFPVILQLLKDLKEMACFHMANGFLGRAIRHLTKLFSVLHHTSPWPAGSRNEQTCLKSAMEMLCSCLFGLGMIRECARVGQLLGTERGLAIVELCENDKSKPSAAVYDKLDDIASPYEMCLLLVEVILEKDDTVKEKPKVAQIRTKSAMSLCDKVDAKLVAKANGEAGTRSHREHSGVDVTWLGTAYYSGSKSSSGSHRKGKKTPKGKKSSKGSKSRIHRPSGGSSIAENPSSEEELSDTEEAGFSANIRTKNPFEIPARSNTAAKISGLKSSAEPFVTETPFASFDSDEHSLTETPSGSVNSDPTWIAVGKVKKAKEPLPIPASLMRLMDKYCMFPGCSECLVRLSTPAYTPFGPVSCHKSDRQHLCSKNLVFSRKPTSVETGTCLGSIVRAPLGKTTKDFLMCNNVLEGCKHKERCLFAHSEEEMKLWNELKILGMSFTTFQFLLKAYRSESQDDAPQKICATKQSADLKRTDDSNLMRDITSGLKAVNPFQRQNSAESEEEPEDIEIIPGCTELLAPEESKFWDFLRRSDIHLACGVCYDRRACTVTRRKHNCEQNMIFCRDASIRGGQWYKVRDRMGPIRLCGNRSPLCPKGDSCQFAHSELEFFIWNNGWDCGKVSEFLRKRLIYSSTATLLLSNTSHQKGAFHPAVLGCDSCSSLIVHSLCTVFYIPHECAQNYLFLKTPDNSRKAQAELWLRVKRRPNLRRVTKAYQICCLAERGCSGSGMKCEGMAHSKLELALWIADSDGEMKISDLQKQLLKKDPGLVMWENRPITEEDETEEQDKILSSPEESDEKQTIPSLLDAPNSAKIEKKVRECCPIDVVYICYMCFNGSNGSMVSYRNRDSCSNRKNPHNWLKNKHPAVVQQGIKAYLIREKPPACGQKNSATSYGYVKICGRRQRGGTGMCEYNYRQPCIFAHNDWEKRLWMWLLKTGMKLADVVKEAPFSTGIAQTNRIAAQVLTGITEEPTFSFDSRNYCFLCDRTPQNERQLHEHLRSKQHLMLEEIDKQELWRFKKPTLPPPYILCEKHTSEGDPFCGHSHKPEESSEWKQRREYLKSQWNLRLSKEHEQLLQKTVAQKRKIGICEAKFQMDPPQETQLVKEKKSAEWTFEIISEKPLVQVAFAKKESIGYFRFVSYSTGGRLETEQKRGIFLVPGSEFQDDCIHEFYRFQVQFIGAPSNKTYDTEIVLDFGNEEELVTQRLVVHSGLEQTELDRLSEITMLLPDENQRWNSDTAEIVWAGPRSKERHADKVDPKEVVLNLQMKITPENYCPLMQRWLTAEQQARQKILASFQLGVEAEVHHVLQLGNEKSVARRGCQYAIVEVGSPLSEDVDLTSLLMSDCESAFVSPVPPVIGDSGKIKVFEVELLGRNNSAFGGFKGVTQNAVYLFLTETLTRLLNKASGEKVQLNIQFSLNVNQFDHWREAVRRLEKSKNIEIVFPDLNAINGRYRQWFTKSNTWWDNRVVTEDSLDLGSGEIQLNAKQKMLIHHAVYAGRQFPKLEDLAVPPLVVFGPFGTGKTLTMAFAVAQILMGKGTWTGKDGLILICTHSHATADLYLERIEKLVRDRITRDRLSRLMIRPFPPRGRSIQSLPETVRNYVPTEEDGTVMKNVSIEDIQRARVVVCTLFGANRLLQLCTEEEGLNLSHIFIDEAAQSLEVETLMPLCLASWNTRIVIAGDHNQIRPKVYLGAEKSTELGISYLERLYGHYGDTETKLAIDNKHQYKVPRLMFNKIYRCHKAILEFIFAEFYGKQPGLKASGWNPNTKIPPLNFAVVDGGEEYQESDSTASWCNKEEAKLVADRVEFLCRNWPKEWGLVDIGIAVGYHDQVGVVRSAIDEANAEKDFVVKDVIRHNIHVGKVISMQGKEFKALIISPVLTQKSMKSDQSGRNLGFFDDEKLINTALTRAKYAVFVVGDPVALCNMGKCQEMWKRYIMMCDSYGGLYNMPN